MSLPELVVLHRRREAGEMPGSHPSPSSPDVCVVDTCLRQVRIGSRGLLGEPAMTDGMEIHQGVEAYRFLLTLSCGLESELAGETEILGQIRSAWHGFDERGSLTARRLRLVMQRLCTDTKEVRSQHLTGLGSVTYGSMVRRLLGGRAEGATLLVGAGQLAATVLPYLDTAEVSVWNRSSERRDAMLASARKRSADLPPIVALAATEEAELAAWRGARNVILCIPADAQRDPARVAAWAERSAPQGRVLHLGIESTAGTPWHGVAGLATLADLFSLRDSQAEQRTAQLARARRGCAEKAQLALLEHSGPNARQGSSQHGWEDLGAFQALGF